MQGADRAVASHILLHNRELQIAHGEQLLWRLQLRRRRVQQPFPNDIDWQATPVAAV